jgi:Uri superfamily endonuclease
VSAAAACVRIEAFPGGRECDIVVRLLAAGGSVPGFGSTDCRVCASHLVRVAAPR